MDEQPMWWEELFQSHERATYPELAQRRTHNPLVFLEAVLPLSPATTISA